MSKYIDADKIEKFANSLDPLSESRLMNALHIIATQIPTEDVAPVIHAHWVGLEYDGYADGHPVYDVFECSNCNEWHCGEEDTLTDYCPHCGARMDEEKQDVSLY